MIIVMGFLWISLIGAACAVWIVRLRNACRRLSIQQDILNARFDRVSRRLLENTSRLFDLEKALDEQGIVTEEVKGLPAFLRRQAE